MRTHKKINGIQLIFPQFLANFIDRRRLYPIMKKKKSVVITGGARGIGLEIGKTLANNEYEVFLLDSDRKLLEAAKSSLEGIVGFNLLEADVRNFEQLERAAEEVISKTGGLDAWVNNAGLARHRRIQDISTDEMDLVIDVNLKGTINGCRAAFGQMSRKKSGRIINIISTASLRGIPTESVYCSAKWGVRGFTQALQEEAAHYGVGVSSILPGGVQSPFWTDARETTTDMEDFLDPKSVADSVVYCLDQDSNVVPREVVIRSIKDNDFSYSEEDDTQTKN